VTTAAAGRAAIAKAKAAKSVFMGERGVRGISVVEKASGCLAIVQAEIHEDIRIVRLKAVGRTK
jgi:hypothetical protein